MQIFTGHCNLFFRGHDLTSMLTMSKYSQLQESYSTLFKIQAARTLMSPKIKAGSLEALAEANLNRALQDVTRPAFHVILHQFLINMASCVMLIMRKAKTICLSLAESLRVAQNQLLQRKLQ